MKLTNIWAIVKKELGAYFNHPLGYILLAVFLGLSNFFFFRTAFLSQEASIRPFFELLPWFFLFLVPAATMKSIAAEQDEGTLEIVLAQPISEIEFLLGKFLGNWLFISIAVGLTLFIPMTLSLGGRLDYGTVFAQYVGAIFLGGAMVAVGILSSTLTKNQTISFIIALFASFALIIIGLDVVIMGLPYPINDVFAELSILRHFQNITRGVIDLRDIVYFFSVGFVFLSITYLVFMARKLNRKAKKYQSLRIGIALMVAIAILINLFGSFISFRFDFTEHKLYSLSKGTVKVLRELDDVITIKFYASKELPAQAALLYRDVKDALQDYKNASRGKLQLVQKFPDSNEAAAEEAQQAGVQPVQFNVIGADEFKVKEGYLGIALSFGDQKEVIPFVDNTSDLEYKITSLIRNISKDETHKIVFTSGHDEKDLSKDLQALNKALSEQYEVESATKKDLGKKLKGADLAIVAGPKKKFDKKEKAALEKFIEEGKSVFLLIDMLEVNAQYGMANPNKDSFSDFSEEFGVKVNKDIVYDVKSNQQIPMQGGGGMSYIIPYPFFPKLVANPKHIVTSRLKEITFPWASSLTLIKGKLGKAKAEALMQTSEYAGRQTSNFNISPDPENKSISEKNLKRYTLGYALRKVGKSSKGRLIVLGDSDFLTDQFAADQQSGQLNPQVSSLVLNSIDWLSQDELLIGIRSKNAQPRQLRFSSTAVKNFVRYFNMVGLVVILVAFGLWRMNRRRKLSQEVYIS